MKKMAAGQFKNRCLAVMDQVQKSGEPVLVTKHGRPVVKILPAEKLGDDIFGCLADQAVVIGDVMSSTPLEEWETK